MYHKDNTPFIESLVLIINVMDPIETILGDNITWTLHLHFIMFCRNFTPRWLNNILFVGKLFYSGSIIDMRTLYQFAFKILKIFMKHVMERLFVQILM